MPIRTPTSLSICGKSGSREETKYDAPQDVSKPGNCSKSGSREEEIEMMKMKYLGHACFLLDDGSFKVIVDPFLTGNPMAACSADEVEVDYIFVTHGHGDHLGDAVDIARRTGATIVTTVDLAETLRDKGVKLVDGNIGGTIQFPFGSARYFQAIHGSGAPGTLSSGFVFDMGGKKIYHAGDTALMMDMQLLAYDELDAALLPIGDFYTMGPADAARAAQMIKAKVTIPMHFSTFPHITQDPYKFAESVQELGLKAEVLKVGEEIVL